MLGYSRIVVILVLGLFAVPPRHTAAAQQLHANELTLWRPIALGAGGLLTGIDIASDGTMVVKTDTFGAYIWNRETGRWRSAHYSFELGYDEDPRGVRSLGN